MMSVVADMAAASGEAFMLTTFYDATALLMDLTLQKSSVHESIQRKQSISDNIVDCGDDCGDEKVNI